MKGCVLGLLFQSCIDGALNSGHHGSHLLFDFFACSGTQQVEVNAEVLKTATWLGWGRGGVGSDRV